MAVWLALPSKRSPEEAGPLLELWKRQGYKIALWRDSGDPEIRADLVITQQHYPGYAQAVNGLVWEVLRYDPSCDWVVTGGDDTEPDLAHTAEEIAAQCCEHFSGTFGIMQPTGDRYAGGCIDRIAGSPWIGREYCERVNGGRGPLWPEYAHMFVDEEAKWVAEKLGVYWQRPDLIHLHHHFMRASNDLNSHAVQTQPPPHLVEANSAAHWEKYKAIFEARKAAGFPGHEPAELVAR